MRTLRIPEPKAGIMQGIISVLGALLEGWLVVLGVSVAKGLVNNL